MEVPLHPAGRPLGNISDLTLSLYPDDLTETYSRHTLDVVQSATSGRDLEM
jgi:hypothetical protein